MCDELVVFDVDNTLVKGQSQQHMLSYLREKRVISAYSHARILAWFLAYKLGLVDNPKKIMRSAYSFLRDQTSTMVDSLLADFYHQRLKYLIYPDAVTELTRHKRAGRDIALLSNAAHPLIKRIALELEVPTYRSTRLEIVDGTFTGNTSGTGLYGNHKVDALHDLMRAKRYRKTHAYADHGSDIGLLQAVHVPVAVNPDRRLRAVARAYGWRIATYSLSPSDAQKRNTVQSTVSDRRA